MPLFTKAPFNGCVDLLLKGADRAAGLEKASTNELILTFGGITGDCHAGLTRPSDSRTLQQYRRNTEIRNVRQVTLLAKEELAEVAQAMGIPEIRPEWVGANILVTGIADLTLLPPSTRLQFPSGATLTVDLENAPCRYAADAIGAHYPEQRMGFVQAATHKRGVTAWVEREGTIKIGDAITLWLPPQRIYAHHIQHGLKAAE